MRNIVVTGGSGFIGTNLIDFLLRSDYNVLNLDIKEPRNIEHAKCWRRLDINNKHQLFEAVHAFAPDYFVHLAARVDLGGKNIDDYQTNILGVQNVIDALSGLPSLRHVIFLSSLLVCRIGFIPEDDTDYCATTPYGESKIIGEKLVKKIEDPSFIWTILRPTSLWGPWFSAPYMDFFKMVRRRLYFHPGNMIVERNYAFVYHSVQQIISILENELLSYETAYLADSPVTNVRKWAELISDYFGAGTIKSLPLGVFRILALIGDLLIKVGYKEFPMNSLRLSNMITPGYYPTERIDSVPIRHRYPLSESVQITCNWLESVE
jgi:GlcNAc-P-P-Und epimerase